MRSGERGGFKERDWEMEIKGYVVLEWGKVGKRSDLGLTLFSLCFWNIFPPKNCP